MRRSVDDNSRTGSRLCAMTASTVVGLASRRACTGAVKESRDALLAGANRFACSMASVPRASCACLSSAFAASTPATCCHAEASSAVSPTCTTCVPMPASVRLRGSRLSPSSQPVPAGCTANTPACQHPYSGGTSWGSGCVGSSTTGEVRLTNCCSPIWKFVLSGSFHGVVVTARLSSAPSRPSGGPALGKPLPGSSTRIDRWPTDAPSLVGVSCRTSDSKSPWSEVPNWNW